MSNKEIDEENVIKYKKKVESCFEGVEAKDVINEFAEEVSKKISQNNDKGIDYLNKSLKALFDELSKKSDIELSAREHIVYWSSTHRAKKGAPVCSWVKSMYRDLGYPIHRMNRLDIKDKLANLSRGEPYIAREIPYKESEDVL